MNQTNSTENQVSQLKTLNIRGEIYHTCLTRKFENRKKWVKPNEKELLSYIPGTVCQIFVKPGDKVDRHTRLLILEAMKMQNIIYSPLEGEIKNICVKEGEKIKKCVVMIEFK